MQYLSRAVTTPIAEIDENSDLCQEKTITETEQGTITKLRSVNKLDAASQLCKVAGFDAPQLIQVTHEVIESPAWTRLQALRQLRDRSVLIEVGQSIDGQTNSQAPAPLSIALAPEEPEE